MTLPDPLVFFVNGKKVVEFSPDPEWTLLYYLRYKLKLCGTKEGCSEGGCGACTVMVSKRNSHTGHVSNLAVNACLTPLCSLHKSAVVTVEGIGSLREGLHPVQERIAKSHGSQCGFCTPGFVMSMYSLLRSKPEPDPQQMETAFQGNLCRCTGYRPILQGFQTFCKPSGCCRMKTGPESSGCCRQNGQDPAVQNGVKEIALSLHDASDFKPYDPSQDPIFPPELRLGLCESDASIKFQSKKTEWFRPQTLDDLVELKDKYPDAKILAGNTEIGVEVKFKKISYSRYIHVTDSIEELQQIGQGQNGTYFGAAVTLTELKTFCETRAEEGNVFKSIANILQWFGGQQIRNVATLGGNLVTASPISDLNPIFVASGASAILVSKSRGSRSLTIDQNFFTGYRSTAIAPDEVLTSVFVPNTSQHEYFWAAKQARRKDDDIAIVNTAIRLKLVPESEEVADAILVYGGMASTTKCAIKTSNFLVNKSLTPEIVDQALQILSEELSLPLDVPGGMAEYREALARNFFFKFYLHFRNWLSPQVEENSNPEANSLQDCTRPGEIRASQLYQIVPANQNVEDLVGRPVVHMAGLKHSTGEAIYVDDTPIVQNELFGAFVLSTKACGKLVRVDPAKALSLDGVVAFFSANDISVEKNWFGVIEKDENIFARNEVSCCGQVVGFIVAESQQLADKGADLVDIQYESTQLPILTIEDAIKQKSFLSEQTLLQGDFEEAFENSPLKLEGSVRIGGQEHFYMETQSCISYPGEDDEIDVLVATQSPSYLQAAISFSLGVAAHKIRVKCRRMGGGFGGKETRTAVLAIVTSLAATRLRRPVRCVLNRVEDMKMSGFRHPFLSQYQVGYEKSGRINAVKVHLYGNAGISFDLSKPVMNRAVMTIDSGYSIPNWHISGTLCRTNLPSNTAFRGFGGPQASFVIETIMDHVATNLGRPTSEIQRLHLYEDGDMTPYDYVLDLCTVKACWDECTRSCGYEGRKRAVDEYNRVSRWKKRGIAILPTKHVIGFTESFLNQAGALVLIYRDGSVALNHGGTEMGQGLHTKMIQIASRVLGISADKIYFMETSTDKVPNTSSTAGSLSSDLNGPAVINACEKLNSRLKPYKEGNPKGQWEDWVNAAYFDRVSLSATGFYSMDVGFDLDTKKGIPCNYITYGVGCSEVEIDCLTGDHTVIRTDIVMDVGESLNPAVDIGQIEGGFVQGYGLFILEELLFSPNGNLLTKGPGMYKIPSVADIPKEFNVSLLRGAPNPRAVYSSKAVGEPPLFLGASVFFAVKEAIRAARQGRELSLEFRLDSPATAERILLACEETSGSNNHTGIDDHEVAETKRWSIVV